MPGKRKIAVVMGGPSLENPVSLATGKNVLTYLDRGLFDPIRVVITTDGLWEIEDSPAVEVNEAMLQIKKQGIDKIFLALHGTFGEDGTIQGLLKSSGISHTGSDTRASSLCFDKILTKSVLRYNNIPVPGDTLFSAKEHSSPEQMENLVRRIDSNNGGVGYPCVVKAPRQGSSFGVFIAQSEDDVLGGIKDPVFTNQPILVEEYIQGTETTCGVLQMPDGEINVLPVTEIVPVSASFFDYEAKYTEGATQEITPARISPDLTRRIQELTARVFEITECRGYGRVDFFIRDEDVFVIEVNTLPGLTKTSLLPQQAQAAGIDFPKLLTLIIESSAD